VADVLSRLADILGGQTATDYQAQTGQEMAPGIWDYVKRVLSGDVAASGMPQNRYDPTQSPAQNARNPLALDDAMNVALSIGPLSTRRPTRPPPADYQMPYVPAPRPAEAPPTPAPDPVMSTGALGHNNPPEATFPQYAEEYPLVGPPTPTLNEKGNIYQKKTPLPGAGDFLNQRRQVVQDVEKGNYAPYFDEEKRYYVDPANYPGPNVDTSTLQPKKQATVDKYLEAINAPETMQALRAAYANGTALGNANNWYAMGQLEAKYRDVLGDQKGRDAFLDEFVAPMAATTSGQDPKGNFLMSHFLERERKLGRPQTREGYELPVTVGGRYAGNNLDDYARMREGGGYAGLGAGQPKMHDFARSFVGDLSHAVMDDQMARGMVGHAGGTMANNARTSAYGLLQRPVHELANELGVQPGNVQDVAWAGFKNAPGKPMMSIINDAIERTHRLTGMPKEEIVVRGLIKKEIPLYGLGAGLGAGGLLGALSGEEQF